MSRRDFPALTGLRFFLALWVILHHLTGPGQKLEATALLLPHGLFTLIRGGYQAVTTFFVLSGFVLTRSYAATLWNQRNTLRYALGRAARVYPVYLLSLAVVAPFILADQTPDKAGYVAAHLLLVQAWLGAIPVNWNTPAWSLSCEMFFYAVFPLAALFIRRANWRSIALAAALACCMTRVMWAAGVSDNIKPLVHLSDFLMGIAAACAYGLLQRRAAPAARLVVLYPGVRRRGRGDRLPGSIAALRRSQQRVAPAQRCAADRPRPRRRRPGAGTLHTRRRLPGKIQLRHVHSARAGSVVVPAPVAGVSAARLHCHRNRHLGVGIWRVRRAG